MDVKILMQDLAAGVAQRSGLLKKDSDNFVRLFFETIEDSLSAEKNVKVKGLGTFKIVEVSGRDSVNVNTGERIHIKGHSKITYTPDTGLRDFVNRPFADFETVVLNDGVDVEKMEYTGETEQPATVEPEVMVQQPEVNAEQPEEIVQQPEVVDEQPEAEEPVVQVEEAAVEEPAVETPAAEEPIEKPEPAVGPVAPVVTVEEPAIKVEQPVVYTDEPVAPEDPATSDGSSGMVKKVIIGIVCVLIVLGIMCFGYCLYMDEINLGGIKPTVEQTEYNTSSDVQAQKDTTDVEPVSEAKPAVEPFDSATVNGRYPHGAFVIVGVQCKHVVAEGETLETIAKQYLKSKSNKVYIQAMNDINMYKPVIEVGQELQIPEIQSRKFSSK